MYPLSAETLSTRDAAANYSGDVTYRGLALNNNALCLIFLNIHSIISYCLDKHLDKDWSFDFLK